MSTSGEILAFEYLRAGGQGGQHGETRGVEGCGSDGGTGRNMAQWVGSGVPARETGHGAVGEEVNREGRVV